MRVVIDLDNTIVDEFGSSLRPGVRMLLAELSRRHCLILWTHSTKQRAYDILRYHDIRRYFSRIICREDYDPHDVGRRKDIRAIDADLIIDDDPEEIDFNQGNRKRGILVASFRKKATGIRKEEMERIIEDLCS
jgi:predicted phosphatase